MKYLEEDLCPLKILTLPNFKRRLTSNNSQKDTPLEPETPAKIFYSRQGNLSSTTQLDREKAEKFMSVADMRRDIVILDSNKNPEVQTTGVANNILAFKSIEPFSNPITLRQNPLYTLVNQNDRYNILVHERIIDQQIRNQHFIDRSDYDEKFIGLLNKAVCGGLKVTLFDEKLSFSNHLTQYTWYGIWFSYDILKGRLFDPTNVAFYIFVNSPVFHMILNTILDPKHPAVRGWKAAFTPLIPIDLWTKGRLFLAFNGQKRLYQKLYNISYVRSIPKTPNLFFLILLSLRA